MASDSKLPLAIFAALVALIAIPFLIDHVRELRRPILLEARVVTATATDPVFRDGRRRISAVESVEAALALRVGRRDSEGRWHAPVARLAIDGREVEHVESDRWPEAGRSVRAFWFSVESGNLGGALDAETAGERLQYRTFLAPEMGRGLRAERLPEFHNDDHIGQSQPSAAGAAGTVRFYVRVEVVEAEGDLRPLQALTTAGVDALLDAEFPTVSRAADLGDAVDATVGELFGLPGFEPRGQDGDWNSVTVAAFGLPFTELVERRIVVSSRTLAAVAVAGRPDVADDAFTDLGTVRVTEENVDRAGRSLKWGTEVVPGDILVDGDHWRVLLADDGNGDLDPADSVLHCWGRPPERTTLWGSLETGELTAEHLRYGG